MRVGACLVLSALAAAGLAAAQPELRPTAPEASECLVAVDPARPAPAYPFEEFRRGTPGEVKVQLRFAAPDKPPRVRVLSSSEWAFAEAVRDWVQHLRTPCLQGGEAVLEQTYLFKPLQERVSFGAAQEGDTARRDALFACLTPPRGSKLPDTPNRAINEGTQGRVHVRMRFKAPDQPPEVELFHRNSARVFAEPVRSWVAGYRLPCFDPATDAPLTTAMTYEYKFEDSEYGFKPLTLVQFMGAVKGIREQTLQVDTNTMACPFDVRLTYLMPARSNAVGVRGPYRAEREPLLQWLRTAELNLKSPDMDMVYADNADIAVPCLVIDLNPKNPKKP